LPAEDPAAHLLVLPASPCPSDGVDRLRGSALAAGFGATFRLDAAAPDFRT
jgi:hypothetical protein